MTKKIRKVVTSDGYTFYSDGYTSCPQGGAWLDSLSNDGKPYLIDMSWDDSTMREWVADGDAWVYEKEGDGWKEIFLSDKSRPFSVCTYRDMTGPHKAVLMLASLPPVAIAMHAAVHAVSWIMGVPCP